MFLNYLGTYGKSVTRNIVISPLHTRRVSDLGAGTWLAEQFGERKVIDVHRFSGHLVICPLRLGEDLWWITLPHNHVSVFQTYLVFSSSLVQFGPEIDMPEDTLYEDGTYLSHSIPLIN